MQLSAANPLDEADLPSADDPSAQQILENLMSTAHTGAGPEPASTADDSIESYTDHYRRTHVPVAAQQEQVAATAPQTVPSLTDRPAEPSARRVGRSRGMLVGAAAAVLLLFGGLLVFAPDTTPSAVATVHSAAAAAAEADTGRIETTFAAAGTDGEDRGEVAGSFDAYYDGDDIAFSVNVAAFDGPEAFGARGMDELPVEEVRLIDGIVYINEGEEWFAIDTDGLLGQMVNDFVDPRSVLQTIQEVTETTEIGPATIDGVDTTQYQSVIDLADESLTESGWLGFEGAGIDAEGEITVDLFVDDAGVLRQFDIVGDLQDPAGSGDNGTFNVSTRFYDIGSDITVDVPADVEVFDPMAELFED